jgi:adenosylmethionine-8-amino-7-oxononanoate aminotransferase
VERLCATLDNALDGLRGHPAVREIRREGLMCGVEIDPEPFDGEPGPTGAWNVAHELYRAGHFTRPIGPVVQFVPPLSSTPDEIASFCAALHASLDRAATHA